jgi:hypothetical protein
LTIDGSRLSIDDLELPIVDCRLQIATHGRAVILRLFFGRRTPVVCCAAGRSWRTAKLCVYVQQPGIKRVGQSQGCASLPNSYAILWRKA